MFRPAQLGGIERTTEALLNRLHGVNASLRHGPSEQEEAIRRRGPAFGYCGENVSASERKPLPESSVM
jgi:hypothetical protein